MEFLDQPMCERHAGGFIEVEMVRFIDDDQIPRISLQHSFVAAIPILTQRVEGSDDVRVELPEIQSSRILLWLILGGSDVEHGKQPFLPLLNERRRAQNEQAPDQSELKESPKYQACFDRFSQANVVGYDPARGPLLRDFPANP